MSPSCCLIRTAQSIQQARLNGLPTILGSVVSQDVHERVELSGIGRLLAITPNDEVNSLATLSFLRTFRSIGGVSVRPVRI